LSLARIFPTAYLILASVIATWDGLKIDAKLAILEIIQSETQERDVTVDEC